MTLLQKFKKSLSKNFLKWRSDRAFKKSILQTKPLQIIVGAGGSSYPGWVPTNRERIDLLKPALWLKYFKKDQIKAIVAEHVWEHLTREEGVTAGKTCYAFLQKGGRLRVAVPDRNHPDRDYIDYVKPGGSGAGADDHKMLYDYKTLREVLQESGFQVHLLEYFDDDHIFHFKDWLPEDGMIQRSAKNDHRNKEGKLKYTSLIIDAIKY